MPVSSLLIASLLALPAAPSPASTAPSGAPSRPTVTSAASADAEDRPRLLVMALERGTVDTGTATTVDALVASLAARLAADREVLSAADMRRLMNLEADRAAMDCKAGESCMAELAAALGADHVLFGTLGQLGGTTIVTLDLFDADAGRPVARETVRAASKAALPDALEGALSRMLGQPAATPNTGWAWTAAASGTVAALAFGGAGVAMASLAPGHTLSDADYETVRVSGATAAIVGGVAAVVAVGATGMWALESE